MHGQFMQTLVVQAGFDGSFQRTVNKTSLDYDSLTKLAFFSFRISALPLSPRSFRLYSRILILFA